jgi:hypothetical protein
VQRLLFRLYLLLMVRGVEVITTSAGLTAVPFNVSLSKKH